MISFDPQVLTRYRDIALLLTRYGQADLVTNSELNSVLDGHEPLVRPPESACPEDLANDLERLGPTFVKLGQLLSTRADLLPERYLAPLSRLQDRVEPVPAEVINRIFTEEIGVPPQQAFASFDGQPLASASLGQVHRAVLHDGSEVAVKIQRPGIRQDVEKDLRALADVAATLDRYTAAGKQFQFRRIVSSLRSTLIRELDYLQEAENCRLMRQAMKEFPRITVPQSLPELCTHRVLTMEYIPGVKITELDDRVLLEIDRENLACELFDCYLDQILVGRMFHADPHPGNLLLTRDRRIALIDMGMVVRVPDMLQRQLMKLLLTISEGRGEETARVAEQISEAANNYDQAAFRHRIAQLVAEHHARPVEELQAGRIVMQIQSAAGQYGVYLPEEVTLLGKTLMNLDRVISRLHPDFDPNAEMRRRARKLLQQQAAHQLSPGMVYQSLMETSEFALQLPERMNKIMQLVADNKLKLNVDAVDERELLKGIQKVANRITTGLILAAIIVGASLMMRMPSSWTLMGSPALAVIFFVIAASIGLYLVYQTLWKDIT